MEKLTSFAASGIIRVYFRERNCFQARKGDHLMRIFKTKNYHIVAIADGKYLTAGEDNLITAEQPNEGKAQLWKLLDAGDNRYRILNTAAQKAVDIIDAGTMNGAWLHLWEQAEVTSQLWTSRKKGSIFACARCPAESIWMLLFRITPICKSGKRVVKTSCGSFG